MQFTPSVNTRVKTSSKRYLIASTNYVTNPWISELRSRYMIGSDINFPAIMFFAATLDNLDPKAGVD